MFRRLVLKKKGAGDEGQRARRKRETTEQEGPLMDAVGRMGYGKVKNGGHSASQRGGEGQRLRWQ